MNKWQEKAIKSLMNEGYDSFTASKLYARAYRRLNYHLLSQGFDRHFEAYMSLVSDKNFIKFDIKSNRLYFVDTGEEVSTANFERKYTLDRLENLGRKYIEVQSDMDEYAIGNISLEELKRRIELFKLHNKEYHKEGS